MNAKQYVVIVSLDLGQCLLACNHTNSGQPPQLQPQTMAGAQKASTEGVQHFDFRPQQLTKDFKTWYNYTYYNVRLAQDFIGLDADSAVISKAVFLRHLATGKFIPFKTMTQHKIPVYKLFAATITDEDIKSTIKQMTSIEEEHYKMEGRKLPAYYFIDLKGKTYSKASTTGKVLVLKCWFIGCTACVKEFPELNRLVDKYSGRDDILFVSLAPDPKQKLVNFLAVKPFKYAVVPNQENYLSQELAVSSYPTHLLVNRQGTIVKVANVIDDLEPFIEKQAALAAH